MDFQHQFKFPDFLWLIIIICQNASGPVMNEPKMGQKWLEININQLFFRINAETLIDDIKSISSVM